MARPSRDGFRIDVDLDHARREADRVRDMLQALRRRHDLSRYEYTRIVRIVPGGDTFSHPILTLGNRFADNEDLLLSTYLHEQMHWYLWHLGTPERGPGGAVLRRAGAALSGGAHRAARRRAQLRCDLPAPRHQLARGGGHLRVHRPRARRWRWPMRSAPTAGSTAPYSGTGTPCRSSTSATAWCRSAAARELVAQERQGRQARPQRRLAKKLLQKRRRRASPRSRRRPPARGGRSAG